MGQEFRLKNIDEEITYLLEEIKQNKLMSRKHKKVCATLNYIEHFFILTSTITGFQFLLIFQFTSLLGIPIGIAISSIGLRIYAMAAWIKEYKSIIKKRKKKHDKIVLLAKPKLNSVEVLNSKVFIDSNFRHDEFVLSEEKMQKLKIQICTVW